MEVGYRLILEMEGVKGGLIGLGKYIKWKEGG
jgi:hypothetical protein